MSVFSSLTLLFDGSFEGLMTAFFEAYARRPHPVAIYPEVTCQLEFNRRYQTVTTDPIKADRVIRGIEQKIGTFAYEKVWLAFCADLPDVSQAIYRYLLWGFEIGAVIRQRLADDRSIAVDKAIALVVREAGHLREFLRFAEMEGGVFYGEISPKHDVLPLLMPHFADRFACQPFIVQDCKHQMAGVCAQGEWYITPSSTFTLPEFSTKEQAIQHLWRTFYHSVAIKERINPALRRQLMPKKYWEHMTEMQPFVYKPRQTTYQSSSSNPSAPSLFSAG